MIKKKTHILCFMLILCSVCQAQKLSIKPYVLYHQPMSKQYEPIFHDIYYRDYTKNFPIDYIGEASPSSKDFRIATGLEYGFTIDYTFRNHLGFELGLGYFNSQVNQEKAKELFQFFSRKSYSLNNFEYYNSYLTDWNYHSIAIRPLFSYAVIAGKSAFIAKIGPVIHYASVSTNAFLGIDKVSSCRFANRLNWGYSTALEYNYRLSTHLSAALELGLEQYNYTPLRATVEYDEKVVPGGKKDEIHYVNKIVNEPSSFFYPSQNKSLKSSVSFNNVYFGIGIKYNLWEK